MEDNYLTILWWFLPHIDMNQPWVHSVPPSWNPLPPPSSPHPSGLSQSTGFGCPASCIKLALLIYFTYGNVHILMLFSQIVPPSPSPTESKVHSLHLYLLCCPACRIIAIVFINSINMYWYTVFVFLFLTYISQYNRFQFHPPHYSWIKCIPFYSWVIFYCREKYQ